MIPPSTKELIDIGGSKYAVVVAVAKRARKLSENKKNDEDYRLSSMVSMAMEELLDGKVVILMNGEKVAKKED
ncbi:MAG TPA: DNA-directed RNA polymerase subunit omega [Syntrophomonadaceae bacterium]|nr:DNA-directed RNA polymerase subunit omega [Syntrophomonadaceae bacterium]